MNRLGFTFITLCTLFAACSNNLDEGSRAKFSIEVSGEAPNATITLTNESEFSEFYHWTFSDGADRTSSEQEFPPTLTVEKAGAFTIQLEAEMEGKTNTTDKTVIIEGASQIYYIEDLEFDFGDVVNNGICFSCSEQRLIKNSELANKGRLVDLVLQTYAESDVISLTSPDDRELTVSISNGKHTKIVTYPVPLTSEEFDEISDASSFTDLYIVDKATVFPFRNEVVSTFETEEGYKGAIFIKSMNSERVLVDIKYEKYL